MLQFFVSSFRFKYSQHLGFVREKKLNANKEFKILKLY